MDQDQGVLHISLHGILIINEVRGEITAIKLHTFDHFQFVLEAFAFFDGDDAFLTNLFHGLGNNIANRCIGISGYSAYLGDFFMVGARFRNAL